MEIYCVGGAVRDELLGLPVKDKDWLVVGATPELMLEKGFRPVGKDFPVFLHPETQEEYALARTERKTAPGYQGFTFHTDETVTLEQDLLRRDLTINAIVRDQAGELIDPLNGQVDIEQRILRHVSDAFTEDPVRILRVARFLARFYCLGFRVADSTLVLMQSMVAVGETKHLVAERVWQECDRALGEKNPECFLEVLNSTGALADILPEFNVATLQDSTQSLVAVTQGSRSKLLRFAAMVFSLELTSIESLCERLAVPNTFRDLALLLKQYYPSLLDSQQLDSQSLVKVIQRLDAHRKIERFELILEGVKILSKTQSFDSISLFWKSVCEAYVAVDPQVFIKQGLKKSALGQAIAQQRINNIEAFVDGASE